MTCPLHLGRGTLGPAILKTDNSVERTVTCVPQSQPSHFLLVVHHHRYLAPMAEPIPPKSPATIEHERTLFRLFPGYLWSERTKDPGSWVWDFGHDIQKTQGSSVTRRWVCKRCIQQKHTKVGSYQPNGINNIKNHLFDEHKIRAPPGESKGPQEKRADEIQAKVHSTSPGLERDERSRARYCKLVHRAV